MQLFFTLSVHESLHIIYGIGGVNSSSAVILFWIKNWENAQRWRRKMHTPHKTSIPNLYLIAQQQDRIPKCCSSLQWENKCKVQKLDKITELALEDDSMNLNSTLLPYLRARKFSIIFQLSVVLSINLFGEVVSYHFQLSLLSSYQQHF